MSQQFPEARFVVDRGHRRRRRSLRGAGQAHDPRRHARRRAALHARHRRDPAQPGRLRATARGRLNIKRLDFGVGQNEWAGTGQVANEVTVDLTVVAAAADDGAAPAARRRRLAPRRVRRARPVRPVAGMARQLCRRGAVLPLDPARGHLSAARASACRSRRSRAVRASISPSAPRTAAPRSGCASTAGRCRPPTRARRCASAR